MCIRPRDRRTRMEGTRVVLPGEFVAAQPSSSYIYITKQMFIMNARGCDIYWMTMVAAHASHSHSLGIISLLQHRIRYIYIYIYLYKLEVK